MPSIAGIALNLLAGFQERCLFKDNIRNSVNDVLILATAMHHEAVLHTEDSLLRRFAAETVGAARTVGEDGLMLLDFACEQAKQRRVSLESKGYINRGWQISERRAVR